MQVTLNHLIHFPDKRSKKKVPFPFSIILQDGGAYLYIAPKLLRAQPCPKDAMLIARVLLDECLDQNYLMSACDNCVKTPTVLLRCSHCCTVGYCSVPCQRAAWTTHRLVCIEIDPTLSVYYEDADREHVVVGHLWQTGESSPARLVRAAEADNGFSLERNLPEILEENTQALLRLVPRNWRQ